MSPRLVFISGWAADATIWRNVLGAADADVGHLHVPWWDCLQDTRALSGALDAERSPAIVVGWSLGGLIALAGAVERPDRVAKLVLISSMARLTAARDYPGADPGQLKAMMLRFRRAPAAVLRDFARACLAPAAGTSADLLPAPGLTPQDLAQGLRYLADTDLRDRLDRLAMPTLILHGRLDEIVPFACAEYLSRHMSSALLEEIPQGGHALPLTHAPQLAQRIRAFAHA
jgi:pimeloyl-[acyl-carrier protein] methyl ester esterase